MELYDVVKKLLGEIDPVAETTEDNARFENLKATVKLTNELLADIDHVDNSFQNRHEASVKKAQKFASDFLDEIGIKE